MASSVTKTSTKPNTEAIRKTLAKRSFDVKFDLVDTDYTPIENIGIGAYGVVCSAIHKKSQDKVAIKKIPCVFDATVISKRTYREIKILKHFKHDNIICIREILRPKAPYETFNEIYVVFDLMESDLHRIIYSDQLLTEEHSRYFLFQILRGLKYIHSANVVHRDLKPSNILVNEDCHLRIGDFGMARGVFSTPNEPEYFMTQYVATRWYRAPEILLSLVEYDTAVDMWSVGCIFAEMLGRKHLFPGKDYMSQLKLIIGVLGSPSEALMKNCVNEIISKVIKALGHRQAIPWSRLFPRASRKALDLLSRMLVLNPAERISVEGALQHRFLSKYHDPDDEPICVPAFDFDFEKENLTKEQLKTAIYKEIMEFHTAPSPALRFSPFLRPAPRAEPGSEDAELDKALTEEPASGANSAQIQDAKSSQTAKEESESVFKKPLMKKSPVSLDANILQVAHSRDIEMLSASSTEMMSAKSVDMKSAHVEDLKSAQVVPSALAEETHQEIGTQTGISAMKEANKDHQEGEKQQTESMTVSSNTKARIKQALLLNRRQRTESCGDDKEDKPKPITALQRQKEREEKRKKKKERALERAKRMKDKGKGSQTRSEILTEADREMLQRWTKMQKPPERKILPKLPTTEPTAISQTVLMPAKSVLMTNTPDIGTQQMGQAQTAGVTMVTDKQPVQMGQQSVQMGQPPAHLIQQPTELGQQPVELGQQPASLGQPVRGFQSNDGSPMQPPGSSLRASPQPPASASSQTPVSQTVPPQTLSGLSLLLQQRALHQSATDQSRAAGTVSEGMLPDSGPALLSRGGGGGGTAAAENQAQVFVANGPSGVAGIHDASTSVFSHSQNHPVSVSQTDQTFAHPESLASHQQSSHFVVAHHAQQQQQQQQQQYYQQMQQQQFHSQQQGYQQQDQDYNYLKGSSPGKLKNVQPQQPLNDAEYSVLDLMGISLIGLMDTGGALPSQNFAGFLGNQNQQTSSELAGHGQNALHGLPQGASQNLLAHHQTSPSAQPVAGLMDGQNVGGMNAALSPAFQHHRAPDFSPPQAHLQESSPEQSFAGVSPAGSPFHRYTDTTSANYMGVQHGVLQGLAAPMPGHPSLPYHQTPQETHKPDLLAQYSGQAEPPGEATPDQGQRTGLPGLRVQCGVKTAGGVAQQPDLIALLSKQLSKSQMEDAVLPALSLTPRGTGAGYGVGMDLDPLLLDSQDHNDGSRVEQSPLSSSLMADWLELSENITLADLEALERDLAMQSSPTSLYPDLQEFHT